MEKEPVYIVIIGNICAGKDTLIEQLKQRKILEKNIYETESVTYLQEAVNHDPMVLEGYYSDLKRNTAPFEYASLASRIILANKIKSQKGIVIGNRYVLEGRNIFVNVNSKKREDNTDPYLTPIGVAIYDLILNHAIQQGLPMPDLAIFLEVKDPEILHKRIAKRGIAAEQSITQEYITDLNNVYNDFKINFKELHRARNLKPPRLVILDASGDNDEDSDFLDRLAETTEAEIIQTYKEKNPTLHKFINHNGNTN